MDNNNQGRVATTSHSDVKMTDNEFSSAESTVNGSEDKNSSETSTQDSSATAGIFKVGEKILATHCGLRYVARVLDFDAEKGHYFIHYDGWNKKWDEWVTPERMFEDNEANRKEGERLKVEHLSRLAKKSSSSKRRKEGGDDDGEDEDGDSQVKLNLPEDLKTYVIKDWENLTQKNKVCNLPKSEDRTVFQILQDFVASKKKIPVMAQICDGLLVYFDRALPNILLYRVERSQYEKLREEYPNRRVCEMYGGEHLLRLFVRLPQLLANTELDESETRQLCARLVDLLKFMSKNATDYFGSENDGSQEQYIAVSNSA